MSDTVQLNPLVDQYAVIENTLRGKGDWCHEDTKTLDLHYFVARNENSDFAISLCGQRIVHISKLQPTTPEKKCLICACYDDMGAERRVRQSYIVARLQKVQETKKTKLKKKG